MKSKLIRDNILDIISASGRQPISHVANDVEYEQALKKKLVEEVQEYLENPNSDELADIQEVLNSLIELNGDDIESIRLDKKTRNGGFASRIILDDIIES
jgi:predicted house-cleaning noncanonical NTP pyrophosphatase (MazG superfamily)